MQAVHDTERRITVGNRAAQDAYGADVEQPAEIELFELHLAVDAVEVFRPAVHLGLDPCAPQGLAQRGAESFDVAFAVGAPLGQRARDAPVFQRFEVAEREVLEFPLHLPDAQAVRQRREHRAGLCGEAGALRLVGVPGGAQSRELQADARDHESRVADDGQQHLAQRLGLAAGEGACFAPLGAATEVAESREFFGHLKARLAQLLAGGRIQARGRQC